MTSDCVVYGQIEMFPHQEIQQTNISESDHPLENIDTFPQKLVIKNYNILKHHDYY